MHLRIPLLGFGLAATLSLTPALHAAGVGDGSQTSKRHRTARAGDLDSIAEQGRTAADTLARLKKGVPEPIPQIAGEPGGAGGPSGVTITPPTGWTVPPGAQGYNVALSPAETGVVYNGTPYGEQFALMIPATYNAGSPPPLVIAWHGYGSSHNQPMNFLATEANNRGWMLMSPLGIADNTFSWLPGQQAVEKSIDWVRANYPYDESRVYGAGFSMGGTCILNFAARHQDPAWTRFAALLTVCGTYDNVDVYFRSNITIQGLMNWLFGGPPAQQPQLFEYERVAVMRLVMPILPPYPVIEMESPGRSIAHLPIYMTWSSDDNQVFYAPTHNTALVNLLTSLGNTPTTAIQTGLAQKHSWSVLNVVDGFNFLATFALNANPSQFTILTDKGNASFNGTKILGGSSGQFRRFDFASNGPAKTLSLLNTNNGDTFDVDLGALGFAAGTDLQLACNSYDATSDTIRLRNAANPNPPSKVRVDGGDNYNWSFDLGSSMTTVTCLTGAHTLDVLYGTFDMALGLTGVPAIGNTITVDLTGGADGEAYGLLYSVAPGGLIPLTFVGDGDPRWLLLDLASFTSLAAGTLSNGGQEHLSTTLANDPLLIGLGFTLQAITAPGLTAGIPFVVGRISNPLTVTIQ